MTRNVAIRLLYDASVDLIDEPLTDEEFYECFAALGYSEKDVEVAWL